ncbi:MAG: ferrous iron transport protein B [Prolixibacteraceae bacterium]|nr:ferrous iron transport protein B [Prolixibacteraceae bacterium]
MKTEIFLTDLHDNDTAVITSVSGQGAFRKRITEMGFIKGKTVRVIKNAPLQDPVEYEIMGYNISLRRREASMIRVSAETNGQIQKQNEYATTLALTQIKAQPFEKTKQIKVALVGNPNCGKTTLFNYASGSHERVGNYGGVTVDAKEGIIKQNGFALKVVDLPGTYSITEYTPEELFVRKHLIENKPDVVVNVIDASNLERNMFLTTQLIDMNLKVVIALNMYDELEQKGIEFRYKELGKMLGIPIVPTVAVKNKGVKELIQKITEVYDDNDPDVRHVNIHYGNSIEESVTKIQALIDKNSEIANRYSSRYLAIKLLENDKTTFKLLDGLSNRNVIAAQAKAEIRKLEIEFGESTETVITDARYGFIEGALRETYVDTTLGFLPKKLDIDHILTHKILGFPVFIFFMWLMFQATFTLGNYPMEWIDAGVGYLGSLISKTMPAGALLDLIVNGILGGVGGVIIFLPNILILFFFISLMEDTGYMARVSFIMDRLMHKLGLHGKSFIPLLMGFGCNVPAVMATRTLGNRKDRIMTMLITPFMSCSARLPVYVLIISAFFTKNQGLVLFSIYAIGIIIAIIVALFLKKTVFSNQDVPFVMELPPYRIPTLRNTAAHMWHKGSQYLKKMGTFILLASILIWGLSYYPRNIAYSTDYDAQISSIATNINLTETEKESGISELKLSKASEHQEKSYIGRIGHFIEPAIQPLGFDWKIGISIVTGLAAKEIVVSSMGVLYHAGLDSDETSGTLIENLREQKHTGSFRTGQIVFTPLVAFGFMLFILIYFPCVAVIAAIKKESNWGWAVFTMFYTTLIAWVASFLVFQIGSLFT